MQAGKLALVSRGLEKKYGYTFAVRNLDLEVRRGDFVALFGRNGAGKTTFLKIAATLVRPSKGTLNVEGFDIYKEPEKARRRIGFLSHNTFVYRDLSALDNLKFFCRLYQVDDSEDRILELLDRVGLRRRAQDPVRAFSRGLQQRVGIARVMLHDPSLILLDEPYTGLDVQATDTLNAILDDASRKGNTVILSSHDIDQGLRAATRAVVMDKGGIVYSGPANDPAVREAYARYIRYGEAR